MGSLSPCWGWGACRAIAQPKVEMSSLPALIRLTGVAGQKQTPSHRRSALGRGRRCHSAFQGQPTPMSPQWIRSHGYCQLSARDYYPRAAKGNPHCVFLAAFDTRYPALSPLTAAAKPSCLERWRWGTRFLLLAPLWDAAISCRRWSKQPWAQIG